MFGQLWEPVRAYWARKRLERMQYETAMTLFCRPPGRPPGRPIGRLGFEGERVEEDPDAHAWRPLHFDGKQLDDGERRTLLDKVRFLADHNPYARNILTLYRNYTVGTGMRHEVVATSPPTPSPTRRGGEGGEVSKDEGGRMKDELEASRSSFSLHPSSLLRGVADLWQEFLEANEWATGNRKDWEFCTRTWRDGECFLRLFRQPSWPPRVHFIDPEHVAADPATGLPTAGIETAPGNVEMPVAYHVASQADALGVGRRAHRQAVGLGGERVDADRILHTKIGVDANVKRGLSIFLPVVDALKRFQGWLDVELIHRKMATSIVYVRKHQQNQPAGLSAFADASATSFSPALSGAQDGGARTRRLKLEPGTVIDLQGFDLQLLSPDSHFDDASLLGRMMLLSIAAGTGLPEFMLSADASNANYASTLVAEGPAVRHFAAWQAFFIGQWRKLFRLVLAEAVQMGLLRAAEARHAVLHITPPPIAVRNRHHEAQADALYFDRGALSARELARRDGADPEAMRREREEEKADSVTGRGGASR